GETQQRRGGRKWRREPRVGLVVACSFLCLVGVVLVCKLHEGDGGPPADSQASRDDSPSAGSPQASLGSGAHSPDSGNANGPGTDRGPAKGSPRATEPPILNA